MSKTVKLILREAAVFAVVSAFYMAMGNGLSESLIIAAIGSAVFLVVSAAACFLWRRLKK
jgi:hypothetical protein